MNEKCWLSVLGCVHCVDLLMGNIYCQVSWLWGPPPALVWSELLLLCRSNYLIHTTVAPSPGAFSTIQLNSICLRINKETGSSSMEHAARDSSMTGLGYANSAKTCGNSNDAFFYEFCHLFLFLQVNKRYIRKNFNERIFVIFKTKQHLDILCLLYCPQGPELRTILRNKLLIKTS